MKTTSHPKAKEHLSFMTMVDSKITKAKNTNSITNTRQTFVDYS